MNKPFWLLLAYDKVVDKGKIVVLGSCSYHRAKEKEKKYANHILINMKGGINDNCVFNTWLKDFDLTTEKKVEVREVFKTNIVKCLKEQGYMK